MPKNIFDLVTSKLIATYYNEAVSNKIPYLGSALFPAVKQTGLDLSWIKGYKGLPVSLALGAFDAKAPLRDRLGIEKVETEMPFFREAMRIGEKERQELLKVQAGMNRALVEPIINRIYSDAQNLIDGAEVVTERMRMQLLSTGTINMVSVKEATAYTYDYKFPAEHKVKLTGANKWSNTEAPIFKQIKDWMDKVEDDTGVRPTRAICTRSTFAKICANEQIKKDMNPVGYQNIITNDNDFKRYLLDKLGISVSVYNKKFATEVGVQGENFFPDDVFTLIPTGTLGNTYFGTTPEEADLLGGNTSASVSMVNTGVAVTTYKEIHPVNSVVVVSEIALPSFEAIDNVLIANV